MLLVVFGLACAAGQHRQIYYAIPAIEEAAAMHAMLARADGREIWGAEAFYSKEQSYFKLLKSAQSALVADRCGLELSTLLFGP